MVKKKIVACREKKKKMNKGGRDPNSKRTPHTDAPNRAFGGKDRGVGKWKKTGSSVRLSQRGEIGWFTTGKKK